MIFSQAGYRARFDWGPAGAETIAPGTAFVAVVDVLSFTTALTVSAEHGIAVLPYAWHHADPSRPAGGVGSAGSAAEAAVRHGAELAVGRSVAGPDQLSLSPPSIMRVAARRTVRRLVLPSPNGSAIAARLAAAGVTVVGVSLRNAAAAADWVQARAAGRPIAVVAAGERWPDGSLRPAVEDLWGAGAFLERFDDRSPEADAAVAAYRSVAARVPAALAGCGSGRELTAEGFAEDVAVAAAVGAALAVPVLKDGWFRPAPLS